MPAFITQTFIGPQALNIAAALPNKDYRKCKLLVSMWLYIGLEGNLS